jgi:hypothetical protein
MQTEKEASSASTTMDPWSLLLYGMKAPMTEKYGGRLAKFLVHLIPSKSYLK